MTATMTRTMAARRSPDFGDLGRIAAAVLIVVCLSSGPFVALSRWGVRIPLATNTWPYRVTYWGAAILGFALFAVDVIVPLIRRQDDRPRLRVVELAPPASLAGWAVLSVLWSDSPDRMSEQAVLMALIVFGAVWIGFGLTIRQLVISLFVGLQGLTLVSVVAAATLTSARFIDDTWMGVFGNPNTLSPIAGLAIVAALGLLTITRVEWAPVAVAGCVVLDLLAVWKADSATGWIALAGAAIAAGGVILAGRLAAGGVAIDRIRVVGTAIVAVVVITIPWTIRVAAGIVGKDRTLTGRTVIWDFVLDKMPGHWVAGYGFESFWDNPANRADLATRRQFASTPDTSHSTFFEVLLYLGVVGLVLLLAVVALSIGRTWWRSLSTPGWNTAWLAAVVTFALLENVTESMVRYHSIFWVLLVAPAFARQPSPNAAMSQPATRR